MTALVTSCKTLFFYKIKAKVKADVAGAMLLFRLLDTDIIDSEILTFLRFFPPSSKMLSTWQNSADSAIVFGV